MKAFMDKEFMLQNPTAQHLYHTYAEDMPICDYHCHIDVYKRQVEEILNLTEGNLATVSCLTPGAPTCHRMAECRTYNMWKGLDEMISDYFSKITLADLAAPEEAGNDYVI